MKLGRFLFALYVPLALCSCSGSGTSTISQVEFGDSTVTLNGKPFSGEIWSDDKATYRLEADNGVVTSFTLYHANGTPAYVMSSPADTLEAFDETGKAIPLDTFRLRYEALADEITALSHKIKGDSITE